MSASDIVFEIVELPHSTFERRESHLHVTVKLTMQEAMLGFKKKIKHLDGHYVKLEKNGVTQPEEVQRITGEGMPIHQQSSTFGDLFIRYKVYFKPVLSEEQKKSKPAYSHSFHSSISTKVCKHSSLSLLDE